MAPSKTFDPDNGIKVGDIITAYHKGFWIVTSIEKRVTDLVDVDIEDDTQEGKPKNSLIHYELVFDANFKPIGEKKEVGYCDSGYCRKIDDAFFIEKINEFNNQIDAFCNCMFELRTKEQLTKFPVNMLSLGNFQSTFVAQKVGEWLDIGGNTRSYADATHSALLKRLLSGIPALEKAPPLYHSYPWYELGEGNKIELDPTWDNEVTVNGTKVHFGNSGPFEWVDQLNGIVVYPPSGEHFRVWKEGDKKFIQKYEHKNATENKSFKPLVDDDGKWTGCDYCGSVDCDGKECRGMP